MSTHTRVEEKRAHAPDDDLDPSFSAHGAPEEPEREKSEGTCGASVGGYPHGFALHERALDQFLDRYWRSFRNNPDDAWLPRRWATSSESTSVNAGLLSMKLRVGSGLHNGQLLIRLGTGTFSHAGKQYSTSGWVARIDAPIVFGGVNAVTANPFLYYANAYKRIAQTWRTVNALALDLRLLSDKPRPEDLEFGGASLTPAEREAFVGQLRLLLDPVKRRDPFVLLYIGTKLLSKALSRLEGKKPVDTWILGILAPWEMIVLPHSDKEAGGELHFSYGSRCCNKPSGPGGFQASIVSPEREGLFRLSRQNVMALLTRKKRFTVEQEGGRVLSVKVEDSAFPSGQNRIISRQGAGTTLGVAFEFDIVGEFRLPIPSSKDSLRVSIQHKAQRRFLCTLELDKGAIVTTTKNDPTRVPPDEWRWVQINPDGTPSSFDILDSPALFESIQRGQMTQKLVEQLIKQWNCVRFNCDTLFSSYANLVAESHKVYQETRRQVDSALASIQAQLDVERVFVQLLEPFTFQKLSFDAQWNLQFDLRYDRNPEPESPISSEAP